MEIVRPIFAYEFDIFADLLLTQIHNHEKLIRQGRVLFKENFLLSAYHFMSLIRLNIIIEVRKLFAGLER